MESTSANIILTSIPRSEFKEIIREVIRETTPETLSEIIGKIPPQPVQTKEDDLIRIEDVIKLLGISKVTLHHWRKQGKLTYYKIGKIVYFKEREVMESLKKIDLCKK
ncbi:MAG: helix-turn-helix domain-containing protein [Ignavibacteriaceae bacterium]|nr:helix-turn-helix domain-containing protein [Ignavibacteriaceae bacterium]